MNSPIDFTLLWDHTEGYAVHCSTKDEAEEFIEWARILFPKMCERWEPEETNYHWHKSETIYTFDAKWDDQWRKQKLMYGSVDECREMGYTVIEFADLYRDIEESENRNPARCAAMVHYFLEVFNIRQEDHELLEPGMRVRIMPRLMGDELYGGYDPESLLEWCGKEATVNRVELQDQWMVWIEEDDSGCFYMEEIECIIDDAEIEESEEPIGMLLGGAM